MTSHRRCRRLTHTLAVALAAGALAAPAALAKPEIGPVVRDADGVSVHEPAAAPEPVIVRGVDDGFDLGSAALGAGVAGALLISAGGLAFAARRHRVPVTR